MGALPLSIKIAQKPCIIGSLGSKALKYESFEGKGTRVAALVPTKTRKCREVEDGVEILVETVSSKGTIIIRVGFWPGTLLYTIIIRSLCE